MAGLGNAAFIDRGAFGLNDVDIYLKKDWTTEEVAQNTPG